jgi:hypothetical protein
VAISFMTTTTADAGTPHYTFDANAETIGEYEPGRPATVGDDVVAHFSDHVNGREALYLLGTTSARRGEGPLGQATRSGTPHGAPPPLTWSGGTLLPGGDEGWMVPPGGEGHAVVGLPAGTPTGPPVDAQERPQPRAYDAPTGRLVAVLTGATVTQVDPGGPAAPVWHGVVTGGSSE